MKLAVLAAVASAAPQKSGTPVTTKSPPPSPDFRSTCLPYCDTFPCTSDRPYTNQDLFLPYGASAGDTEGARRDDTAEGPIVLSSPVPFFEQTYDNIFFSSNGVISFNSGVSWFTSQPFPLQNRIMFSPFWADFDTSAGGNWYYRILTQSDIQIANDIVGYELDMPDFEGVTGVVVTYSQVDFYGSYGSDRRNSVQAILVHDNNWSIAIFNYGDIEWTTGAASGGNACTGLDGNPAQIGFNDGNGNFYIVPGSQTDDIIDIETRTNVKTTGRFVFIVNGTEITDPGVINNHWWVTNPPTTTISSTNTKVGIEQFLAFKGFDYSLIADHGCYCSVLSSSAAGEPSDDLDKICRSWINARRCSLTSGGQCFGAPDTDYNAGTENCVGSGINDCDDAACGIDEYWFNELESFFTVNQVWAPSTDVTCTARPSTFVRDSCCGSEPATMTLYSSDYFTCDEGELLPIIEGF